MGLTDQTLRANDLYHQGLIEGYDRGLKEKHVAYQNGLNEGLKEGTERGNIDGYHNGYKAALNEWKKLQTKEQKQWYDTGFQKGVEAKTIEYYADLQKWEAIHREAYDNGYRQGIYQTITRVAISFMCIFALSTALRDDPSTERK